MALLQIAEPGQSTVPHEHRLAVGIDLGTTNSLVATVKSGLAETLANEQGKDSKDYFNIFWAANFFYILHTK